MNLSVLAVEPEESVVIGAYPQSAFGVFECGDDVVVGKSATALFGVISYFVVTDAE